MTTTASSNATPSTFVQLEPNFDFTHFSKDFGDENFAVSNQNIFVNFVEEMSNTEPFNSLPDDFITPLPFEAFDAFQQDDAQPEVQVRVGVWFEIVFKFRLAF